MTEKDDYKIDVVNIRLVKEPSLYSETPIQSKDDVVKVVADELKNYDREVFAILNLKTNGQVINLNICSVGTLNEALISPREVLKSAILSNAAAFIAVHNHPSGNLNPSKEDIDTTKRLMMAGEIINIKMVDHVIIASETGEVFSMRSAGLMNVPEKKSWER